MQAVQTGLGREVQTAPGSSCFLLCGCLGNHLAPEQQQAGLQGLSRSQAKVWLYKSSKTQARRGLLPTCDTCRGIPREHRVLAMTTSDHDKWVVRNSR